MTDTATATAIATVTEPIGSTLPYSAPTVTKYTSEKTKEKALIAAMIFCALIVVDCLHFVHNPAIASTGLTMSFFGLIGVLTNWCFGNALLTKFSQ